LKRNRLKKIPQIAGKRLEKGTEDGLINTVQQPHLDRQIPPLAHTSMYVWHKYWSRKTWNVVGEYIKTYCPEGGIVFDPFAGSGITAMEALKNNRRAIVCDLNPIATEIIRLTIKPVKEIELHEAFERVKKKVRKKIESLYLTECRNCCEEFPLTCAIWEENKCVEIRYQSCPKCGATCRADCELINKDKKLLQKIESSKIKEWYPTNKFYYPDGRPFMKKERYDSVDELFTKRNLQALAWLMEAIEEEPKKDLRDFLKIGFSSMSHLCTKMTPVRPTRPFSSVWNEHSYWFASQFMELNVWDRFESAIIGRQGLIRAKTESNKFFKDIKIGSTFDQVISGKADVFIYNGSCMDLMKKMPADTVDYIFTDPPYDASIQYGELSYMWVSWLKMNGDYLKDIVSNEIVRNEKQQKTFSVYHSLLKSSFESMFKVLKPRNYLTLTFHNPTFKVRNATIRAGVFTGFEFLKIHHQELARPSAKSLLQPFGSAQGDFYLRFYKPELKSAVSHPKEIDELRFEKIVVDTTVALLAERAEPTPYTIIINYIDPVLAKQGYFSSLQTGLDINAVLKNHLEKEFVLLPTIIGGAEGKLWWFKDTSIVPRLSEIPLTERVEQTVYRKLYQKGKVTFTEVWDAVSTEFPNSLTSDSTSILDALKIYARHVTGGYWMLKPEIHIRMNQHSGMIVILALIGQKQGYDIWIGRREQAEVDNSLEGKKLAEYMTLKGLKVVNASNQQVVENIDLLWIQDKKILAVFEIESTTSMMSALMRGSNVDTAVDKFMIIPEERETQFNNKMTSPLFREHFENENWKIIFFDALRAAYTKEKINLDIYSIINLKKVNAGSSAKSNQERLF
jgi:16S rRNA G966 N2-methylase RsmD